MPERRETDEERAARKEKERREREAETPAQREERKAREAERDRRREGGGRETDEQRAARKEKERREREAETPAQREERKAREAERDRQREGGRETDEQRAARKEKERREREAENPEARKQEGGRETDEQRAVRKERERSERKARDAEKKERDSKKEVVHKPLPQTHAQQSQHQQQPPPLARSEPVVQGRNPNLQPVQPSSGEPEEYDDDFEDAFEPEKLVIANKAVQEENAAAKRLMNAAPAPSTSSSSGAAASGGGGGSPVPDRAGVVGQSRFGADDLQRQKYRQQFEKDKERGEALRRLVVFDEVSMVIADIPPLSEYDMYIRNFGGTGRTQSGVQAPALEDKIDVEVQAERVASKSKMSQCPEDLGLFPERAAAAQTATTADDGESGAPGATRKIAGPTAVDATMLSSFLSRVFPVMRTLLDESHFGHGANIKKSTIPLSDSFTTFAAKETAGRPVQRILYNPTASQYVLCLHGAKVGHANAPEKRLPSDRSDGLAVVWNINDQTMPDKLLTHSCSLNAACFSPSRPHLVYGGGHDGAVCIWDLRETDSLHHSDDKVSTITLRAPSFTTEWQHENHKAPIVQMCVAGYNSILGNRRDENDQLVTLDQDGNVHFWMVNDGTGNGGGSAANSGGGASSGKQTSLSDQDHGQLMGSIVRCFRAASLSVGRPLPSKSSTSSSSSLGGSLLSYESPQSSSNNNKLVGNAFDFDFCPADPSRFVVAAGASLHHLSRFSSIAAPSSYGPHSQFFGDAASAPSACSFSTLDSRILIGGYSDGSVRVYLRDEALPQLSIPISFTPIRQVQTSNTIKLITFALDENGVFYILDHGIDEKEVPVVQCSAGTPQTGKCTAFSTPLEDKGSSQLAFGFEDGSFQLHTLNNKWLAPPNTRSERWL